MGRMDASVQHILETPTLSGTTCEPHFFAGSSLTRASVTGFQAATKMHQEENLVCVECIRAECDSRMP